MSNAQAPKTTAKQMKFVQGVASGKTGVQAALDAYDTTDYNTANAIAVENLQKPTIKAALATAYEKAGLTADMITTVLVDGMSATKSVHYDGELIESDIPDHSVRVNAARTAAMLVAEKGNTEAPTSITFNVGNKYIKNGN